MAKERKVEWQTAIFHFNFGRRHLLGTAEASINYSLYQGGQPIHCVYYK